MRLSACHHRASPAPRRGPKLILAAALALGALALLALLGPGAAAAHAPEYVPGEVIVGYGAGPTATTARSFARRMSTRAKPASAPRAQVLSLPRGTSVTQAVSRLRHQTGVAYAVPNYIAHEAGAWFPNDRGLAGHAQGWEALQWNFQAGTGVDAPTAWGHMFGAHKPGGKGATVAVLDTGVAYRNWHKYRRSPDFAGTKFVDPYDFVAHNAYPLDREGHGTFVAGEIAETTNNGLGLTGLAYGASVMPVRILDASGEGDAATISTGIRYAVNHGANVINLSLEFDIGVRAADIPDIINAITYAHSRGVAVVAASGNEGLDQLAYPAADPNVISVGATTYDRCRADYSNGGAALDLVAPGGGDDDELLTDPNCHADAGRELPTIYQMTMVNAARSLTKFGYPGGVYGTSMAAPLVTATAALVIASGVIGSHPTPDAILNRLEATAQPLGSARPNVNYGYGMLNAGAATAPVIASTAK